MRDRFHLGYALAEGRSVVELIGLAGAAPLWSRLPEGDGHPVIVAPGWLGGDGSTWILRRILRAKGYRTYSWGQGVNLGGDRAPRLAERVDEISRRTRRRASLVGWSLGGVYARDAARLVADRVRFVVTLGSPVHPTGEAGVFVRSRKPPPVPTTAIYSHGDGIVPPAWCGEHAAPHCENVEVPGSHMGLGHNPLVVSVILDRLAQRQGAWRPFDVSGLRRAVYRQGAPVPSASS